MTEDEMVGWHHQLDGHEFEQALGDGEGQRSLGCCSPWGSQRVGNNQAAEPQHQRNKYKKRKASNDETVPDTQKVLSINNSE